MKIFLFSFIFSSPTQNLTQKVISALSGFVQQFFELPIVIPCCIIIICYRSYPLTKMLVFNKKNLVSMTWQNTCLIMSNEYINK